MKRNRKYTEEFRISVVKEYLSGGVSKHALCKKYSIPQQVTLSTWIRKFVGEETNEYPMSKEISKQFLKKNANLA